MRVRPPTGLFRLLPALAAAFLPLEAAAQSSITYTPTFTASGVNMWGSGVATNNANYFYGTSWNVSGSVGSITETAVGDFGGRIFGSTSGQVGLGVQLTSTAGHVDVNLPYRVTISSATNLSNAGTHTLNVSSTLAAPPSGTSYVASTFASAGFDVTAKIQATATIGGEVAFFDRTGGSVQVLNTNFSVPVASFANNTLTFSGMPLDIGGGITLPLPPPFTVANTPKLATPGSLTVVPPSLNANSGAALTTSASQPGILSLNADLLAIATWAAGLPFNPLDTSLNVGPIGFTKRDLSVNVGVSLGLAQEITVNPGLGMILRSSTPLTYSTPSGVVTTNALVVTNLSQPITFAKPAGDVAIFPEFFLTPTLRNNTDLILGGSFSLDAATYGYSFFSSGGTLGPLFTYDTSTSTNIGLVDSTFNVTGTGLNISQLGRSLTNVAPTIGNVTANQSVNIPGLVGSFSTSSIAENGRLFLSAGSLYLNNTSLTVAANASLELAAGSGASANRLDTPGLNNLGRIQTGNGSTLNITAANGFANVNASGVLSGGTYDLGGTFTYVGPSLTANQANLTLNYGGSLQNSTTVGGTLGNALATLGSNSGTLTLKSALNTGRAFTNTGILDLYDQLTTTTFANSGLLFVQGGGKLLVTNPNGFTGVNASGVLSGNYYLNGQIAYQGAVNTGIPVLPGDTPVYFPGYTITTNSGNLTLAGPSADPRISNLQPDGGVPQDALATLSNNTGNFILNTGARQTLSQGLVNNGGMGIFDVDTKLTVGGNFNNAAGRTLTVRKGTLEVFHSSFDYNFTNNGTLNLEQNGRIEVDGTLGNFSNVNLDSRTGTLTGGTWNVGGTIAYGTGNLGAPNIREIGAGTTINMLGGEFYNQFFNQSALSYLAINRGTLSLGSSYVLKSNSALTNTGTIALSGSSGWLGFVETLTNTGTITIGAGSTLSSFGNKTFADTANWTNVSTSGLLSGIGQLVLAGTLEYKGTPITGLASGSDLTLSGDSWRFRRKTGASSSIDGLGLTTLGGALRLANRAKFETPVGATFTVQSTGTLATSSDSGFVVRQGLLSVAGGATVSNNGVILLQHSGTSPATFGVTGNVTLAGTGSLQLTNFSGNGIIDSGGTLTNSATHLIAGAGSITAKLVNRGTIESIGSAGLYFQNSAPSALVNSGIIRSGNSLTYPLVGGVSDFSQPTVVPSQLTIYNTTVTNFEGATAGRLIAANRMWIGVSTVNGGRVEVTPGGLLTLDDANLLGGVFDLQTAGRVEIYGGRVRLDGTSLSSAAGSTLTLLDVGNPVDPAILEITGAQPFLHYGSLVMRNNSRLEGSAQFVNHGSLLVHQPGVSTVPVINANFRNASDGLIDIDKSSSLRWAGDASNAGRVNVGASGDNSAGIAGTLSFPGNTTLSGGGEIRLGALIEQTVGGVTSNVWSASGRLTAPSGTAPTLTNADNTLSGAGTIGDTRLGLINQAAGTVRALGGTLLLNPGTGGVTNQGLFRAEAGARLEINTANGAFTNYSSVTNTLTGGRYEAAGTIAVTGADLRTNAAELTVTGTGQFLNATTNTTALGNLTTNASGGTLRFNGGASHATAQPFTNNGTIVLGGPVALASGTLSVGALTGNGTITFGDNVSSVVVTGASGNSTYSGTLAGPGSLSHQGGATTVLSGANTFSGGVSLTQGTIVVGHNAALGTGTLSLNGGTLAGDGTSRSLSNPVALVDHSTIGGSSPLTFTGTLTNYGGSHTLTIANAVTFANLALGSLGGNRTVTLDTLGSATVTGVISNGGAGSIGALAKTGVGTLTLSGNNTFTGGVTLSAGTLFVGHTSALGTGTLTLNGGTLQSTAGLVLGNAVTLAGNVAFSGNAPALAGTVSLLQSPTLTVATGTGVTISGAIGQSGGTYGLTKDGGGTLALTGASTFGGTTTVTGGTLFLARSGGSALAGPLVVNAGATAVIGAANQVTDSAAITINGGQLALNGVAESVGAAGLFLTGGTVTATASGQLQFVNGGGITTSASSASSVISAPVSFTTGATHTLSIAEGGAAADLVISGVVSQSGGSIVLTKSGAGLLSLTGANSFGGSLTMTGGTLALGHPSALGSASLTLNGGTLRTDVGVSLSAPVAVLGGSNVINTNGQSLTLSGLITNGGALTKTGAGTLSLSGANTYGGGTTLQAGTLSVSHNSALGTGTLTLQGGSLQAPGTARTLANPLSLQGNFDISNSPALTLSGAATLTGSRTLTVGTGSTALFTGTIGQSGGTFGLTKLGSGTLALVGANTYGGNTVISAGTVNLFNASGSAFGTGSVSVAAGATLSGTGRFTGPLTLAGTVSPGSSPGILSTGSATWQGGGTYLWEINDAVSTAGVGWDLLAISGSLSITATPASKFNFTLRSLNPSAGNTAGPAFDFTSGANYSFTVATTTGGISGFNSSAFAINTSGFANPFTGTWSLAQVGNNLDLVYTGASAIPEPSTYAAAAGAAALALAFFRRRGRRRSAS
ncbi:MAG: autotransporter-associated beta strand repeat-containing protein [Verrucomicrobia bacterium]|nr:autotransporter-associated beta strand repeat-containing protein [Verrucomicrobiota bacterium]